MVGTESPSLIEKIGRKPKPPLWRIWAEGIKLYPIQSYRGAGVFVMPDRTCWWVQFSRKTGWEILDRDLMDD